MKLVIQRVKNTTVKTVEDGKVAGEIGPGFFVLLGIKKGDTTADADFLANKLVKLRIMSDKNDKMNLSVVDAHAEILVVSQFTLYANTDKGNRPSFIDAEFPENAEKLYKYFVDKLKKYGVKVETGKFGAYMNISADLDGPVTIILES